MCSIVYCMGGWAFIKTGKLCSPVAKKNGASNCTMTMKRLQQAESTLVYFNCFYLKKTKYEYRKGHCIKIYDIETWA